MSKCRSHEDLNASVRPAEDTVSDGDSESYEAEQAEESNANVSFLHETFSAVSVHEPEPTGSRPQAVQQVLPPMLRFDVDGAFEQVKEQAYIRGMRIYKPYLAALSFGEMLPLKYVDIEKLVYTDPRGVRWKPECKYHEETTDLACLFQTCQEEEFIRCLCWQLRLGGNTEFKAARTVYDHGWLNTGSYKYVCVLESGGDALKSRMNTYEVSIKSPDYKAILISRVLVTVLDTLDHLHQTCGMVVTNLFVENLFLRPDNKSGYLGKLDVQQADPMIVETNQFPYYSAIEAAQ